MTRAVWNGAVLAESDQALVVEGNHYFPPESVDRCYLRDSETTTFCGWKGTAGYYSIEVDGQVNSDAAWFYAEPFPAADSIKNHVAFWKGVKIE